jgi:hypothetical protein
VGMWASRRLVARPRVAALVIRTLAAMRLGSTQRSSVSERKPSAVSTPDRLAVLTRRGSAGIAAVAISFAVALGGARLWLPTVAEYA